MASQYNYTLFFKGWAQCRLATDPDPDYEPRGVSGYTFALPGEPDLDRIINFQDQNGVFNRSFAPKVGVHVIGGNFFKTKDIDGYAHFEDKQKITKGHPLFGAAINLLDNPTFSSHNSVLVYNGYGIMDPIHFEIAAKSKKGETIKIRRRFHIDPTKPNKSLEEIPINVLTDYTVKVDATNIPPLNNAESSSKNINDINIWGSPNMLYESGILDPIAYRQERLKNLKGELAKTIKNKPINRIAVAALNKRISELEINQPTNRRTAQMGAKVLMPYALNSKKANINGKLFDAGPAWALEMWMGGWDADSLCFYIIGTVEITLNNDPFK